MLYQIVQGARKIVRELKPWQHDGYDIPRTRDRLSDFSPEPVAILPAPVKRSRREHKEEIWRLGDPLQQDKLKMPTTDVGRVEEGIETMFGKGDVDLSCHASTVGTPVRNKDVVFTCSHRDHSSALWRRAMLEHSFAMTGLQRPGRATERSAGAGTQ